MGSFCCFQAKWKRRINEFNLLFVKKPFKVVNREGKPYIQVEFKGEQMVFAQQKSPYQGLLQRQDLCNSVLKRESPLWTCGRSSSRRSLMALARDSTLVRRIRICKRYNKEQQWDLCNKPPRMLCHLWYGNSPYHNES